ncbi:helix-turn-helix transcriptional regulator [Streptomyces sp. ISL-12]|uniref:helix-turn-helix domain-containing protein n=1 Tax=Streptomyces sp. ISL-12 TaxID=2819177 RepID=UPI001BEBB643|nr:helix-turn-helix transcriptional regulator [Streptomyces sp. ISL-12]MBT2409131.1 helix-turn-helix transcriptional regulator [Streptomyces sp. ISL-12]
MRSDPPPPDWVIIRLRAIGERIRAHREARDLGQAELGEMSGIGRTRVERAENGASDTDVDDLLLIANALDVPVEELVADGRARRRAAPATRPRDALSCRRAVEATMGE